MSQPINQTIGIDLTASVVALVDGSPALVTVPGKPAVHGKDEQASLALPSGPFAPLVHRTLELGLRGFVEEQTGFTLGYIEQLYTFGDRGRHATAPSSAPHFMSIGYLALTQADQSHSATSTASDSNPWSWQGWYRFFPWEDWREGRPPILDQALMPALQRWLETNAGDEPPGRTLSRAGRVAMAFGEEGAPWDEERVLERYELIYEAGLAYEALRDGRQPVEIMYPSGGFGTPMVLDHRRIVATAIARLRGKMKYRPVVFEVMPESFTLTGLQSAVEAISGRRLHKQNFRRLVDNAGLVEPTGATTQATGGRPAALYRFRRDVMAERPSAGLRFGQPVVR